MRVALVFNPISGSGQASADAVRLEKALTKAGHEVMPVATQIDRGDDWLDEPLAFADVLIVIGGDGAIRMVTRQAARAATPVRQWPRGTENLFAREFNMNRDVGELLAALSSGQTMLVDLAQANGRPFVLMASIGLDAEVVHDLAARRGASISHFSYARPILRQLLHWRAPALTVEIDGEALIENQRGMVIVANSRQYARSLNPAFNASMTDGRLDIVFLPVRSSLAVGIKGIGYLVRGAHRDRRAIRVRGERVRITSDQPFRYQVDGDPPEGDDQGLVCELNIALDEHKLPVLLGSRL